MARTVNTDEFEHLKFLVFEMIENGRPICSMFETAKEVSTYLWGKDLKRLAVFKDGEIVHLESADIEKIRKQLEDEETPESN